MLEIREKVLYLQSVLFIHFFWFVVKFYFGLISVCYFFGEADVVMTPIPPFFS